MEPIKIYFDDKPEHVIAEVNKILAKNHLLKIVEIDEPKSITPVSRTYEIKIIS